MSLCRRDGATSPVVCLASFQEELSKRPSCITLGKEQIDDELQTNLAKEVYRYYECATSPVVCLASFQEDHIMAL